jgi:hypothetical protein
MLQIFRRATLLEARSRCISSAEPPCSGNVTHTTVQADRHQLNLLVESSCDWGRGSLVIVDTASYPGRGRSIHNGDMSKAARRESVSRGWRGNMEFQTGASRLDECEVQPAPCRRSCIESVFPACLLKRRESLILYDPVRNGNGTTAPHHQPAPCFSQPRPS